MLYLWCVLNECFVGGLAAFRQSHDDLCEHSLHLEEGQHGGTALPHSLPSTPDIENADLTAILPALPGQRAGRSGPGAHAAHGHRLHPERHHAHCRSTTTSSACSSTSACHRQQQAEPAAVLRGGLRVHRYDSKLCRRKTCHEYFNQEDNLAERESGFILLQQKTNVFIYLLRACVCVHLCIYTSINKQYMHSNKLYIMLHTVKKNWANLILRQLASADFSVKLFLQEILKFLLYKRKNYLRKFKRGH